jgi:hypothetical protein
VRLPSRGLLFVLPTLTVGVVGFALFAAGGERTVRAARLYGGPTSAKAHSFRLELIESARGVEAALGAGSAGVALRTAAGDESVWHGAVGPDGIAEVSLPPLPSAAAFEARVMQGDRELARGRISLDERTWCARANHRGGWLGDRRAAPLQVLVAPARGVLAVPFPDELLIDVRHGPEHVSAELSLQAEGGSVAPEHLRTSGSEPTRVTITPREHVVTLRAQVVAAGYPGVDASFSLPVVPGALDARIEHGKLLLSSPVPRDRAYFALVSEHARVAGGSVALIDDERGVWSAVVPLPPLPAEALWAVVSSTPDLSSPARVGWPLLLTNDAPAMTYDVPERLLLDGLPPALRREARRQKRVKLVSVFFCGVSLSLSLLLLAARARRAEFLLDQHLRDRGLESDQARSIAPLRRWSLVVAALCVALGFLALSIFAYYVER